jgi:hypothetical protein
LDGVIFDGAHQCGSMSIDVETGDVETGIREKLTAAVQRIL